MIGKISAGLAVFAATSLLLLSSGPSFAYGQRECYMTCRGGGGDLGHEVCAQACGYNQHPGLSPAQTCRIYVCGGHRDGKNREMCLRSCNEDMVRAGKFHSSVIP